MFSMNSLTQLSILQIPSLKMVTGNIWSFFYKMLSEVLNSTVVLKSSRYFSKYVLSFLFGIDYNSSNFAGAIKQ